MILIINMKKKQLKFLIHIMRKMCLKSLTITSDIEGTRERERKRRITYLTSLCKLWADQGF